MQNVLKRKYVFWFVFAKYVHLDLFYVLDYSGSFDMHIENYKKTKYFWFSKVRPTGVSELNGLVRN